MSTNKNLRKKQFTEDLMYHFAQLPDGAWRHRQKVKLMLHNFTNDLAYLDALPTRLKNLDPKAFFKLVIHWKKRSLSAKTLRNRLGIIRKILLTLPKPIHIPTNKELDIIIQNDSSKAFPLFRQIDPYKIDVYPAFIVREVCIMQYLFGLKVYEAIRLDSSMIYDYYLEIPRSISFNKKDRRIPILLPEQKEFIEKLKTHLKLLLPIPAHQYQAFIILYHDTEKELKANLNDYFRFCYIRRRYQELITQYDHFQSLDIIKAEVGFSKISQIKGALSCPENS